ncbi:hypothetical protein PspLS_09296 [Pyricularia sp. CBS 133598]|nr:hypothetical protein PspLS_09296 [Pyricularia sp. CBS 133598]
MRLLKLATVLVVAASGVQAVAVARDAIDNQAVQINYRRAANAKLVARANEGQGANEVISPFDNGVASPVQPVKAGDGNAPRAGRRQRFRQKISAQWDKAVTGWGPKAVENCKCAVKNAYNNCKCAAKKFADHRRKKSNTATAAFSDQPDVESQSGMAATAVPKASFLKTCKHGIKIIGEKGQVLGCKLKDMAQERFPKLRKSTAKDRFVIIGTPIPRTRLEGSQGQRVEKRGKSQHEPEEKVVTLWDEGFSVPKSPQFPQKPKPRVSASNDEATGPVSENKKWQQRMGDKCKCLGQKIGEKMSNGKERCKCVYDKWVVQRIRKQRVGGEAAAAKAAETEKNLGSNSHRHQHSRRSGTPTSADATEGVKSSGSDLKKTGNSWDLAGYFKQACQSARQNLKDARCPLGGQVAKDKGTPSSPSHRYQGLSQEDPDSPRKDFKRAESANRPAIPERPYYAAQPRPYPDPADRPGYQRPSVAHKQMFQEMGTAVKYLVKGEWRTKHAQQGQTKQQASLKP